MGLVPDALTRRYWDRLFLRSLHGYFQNLGH